MFERLLFEDKDYRLTVTLLGSYKIFYKARRLLKKASREEGQHFLRVLECLRDRGVEIEQGNEVFNEIAIHFCGAALVPGDVTYRAWFGMPPHTIAGYGDEN